jgi:predicted signal transduction protein with EAL and GGDEF domain
MTRSLGLRALALSESLGIQTVAEGIETDEQGQRMRSFGCTYGQGYLFARPMPESEIIGTLTVPAPVEDEPRISAPKRAPAAIPEADAAPA